MTSSITNIDQRLLEEAKNGDKLWRVDPYEGKLEKEVVTIGTQADIERKLAEALININPDDPDLQKLPMIGILNSLKKDLDKKYKVDTLKQLETIDKLALSNGSGGRRPRTVGTVGK